MAINIDDLLRRAVESRASDLHLKVGNHPYLRVDGILSGLTDVPRITPEEMLSMAFSMMTNRQKQKFKETAELDMAYGVAGLGRFRVNVFQQRGNVGMVLRVIPTKIRTIEELELPRILTQICEEQRGLILTTGTTGSGKSTTLAAMIDRINSLRAEHIITIEDPIEYLHRDKKGFINQREVEVDTSSFSTALARRSSSGSRRRPRRRNARPRNDFHRAARRRNRPPGSLDLAHPRCDRNHSAHHRRLSAARAEADSLAARLHAESRRQPAPGAQERRPGPRPRRRSDDHTGYIRDCIINPDKTRMIRDAIAAGTSQYGMQTFDQSLFDLYSRNLITLEEALMRASNPDDFRLRVQGVRSSADSAREEMERAMTEFERLGHR